MTRLRGIFAQVYLHGFLLIVAVTLSTIAVLFLVSGNQRRDEIVGAARFIHDQIVDRWDEPERLRRELRRQARSFKFSASVFDANDEPLARVGRRPPHALGRRNRERLASAESVLWVGRALVAIPLRRGDQLIGYAVGRAPIRPKTPARAVAVLLTVVAILALVSIPFVKRIVRPLNVIGDTARALGEGQLSARTGLARSDEIGDLARVFDEMAEKIQRSSKVERELMANVSHELRTPLARLRVALELAGDVAPERRKTLLEDALRDIEEMDELTEEILTVARLELGHRGIELEPVQTDADQWLSDRVDRARLAHPDRTIELPETSIGLRLFDSKWLGRAVDNLLENAVKYSSDEIRVIAGVDGTGWRLSVEDRGEGISDSDLEQIFTPFYRASGGSRGFGLGLTLAKRVVEAHGGRLSVESQLGAGSTFTVRLFADPPGFV
ncbi:MAG: HAMP domain-containing sensor histidine kinase [Myxococcota bacterium]